MRRTFNCGLGLVAVVPPADAETVRAAFEAAGEHAFVVGDIARRQRPAHVEFV